MEDVKASVRFGANMLGFVLSDSPRRATYDLVADAIEYVAGSVSIVCVFASIEDLRVFEKASTVSADYYQVYFAPPGQTSLPPRKGWIRARWTHMSESAIPPDGSIALYDFKLQGRKGLANYLAPVSDTLKSNIILAGNLDPVNVGDIVRTFRPLGVDVARGTEITPGIKDHEKLRRFINEVHNA